MTHIPTPVFTRVFLPVVRSHSHRVRGVQSPGPSGDGIPGLLHPGAAGDGAGALQGWMSVGETPGDGGADAGRADPRGRWVMVENTFNLSTSLMFPTEKSAHKQHKNNLETFYDCTEAFFF